MSAASRLSTTLLPAAALVAGTALVKQEWLPFAIAAAAAWGALRYFTGNSGLSSLEVQQAAHEATDKANELKKKVNKNTLGVLNPEEFQEYPLRSKDVKSHNTAIYRFALPKDDDVLGLPIGQHISIAAHVNGEEKEVVRSYTPISSDENDKGYFDLMIKSYPTGRISKHMGELKIGDTMRVRGPKGAMKYSPNMCRHIGMIAGGTGITPMLQIIKAIQRGRKNGDKTEVDLIFANVNEDDILLRESLNSLTREDPGFRVHYVLNNPPQGWMGGVGFVTADMIKANLPAPADDIKILVCGPPPMVSAMKKAMEPLGYQKPRPVSRMEDQVFCF